MKNHDQKLRDIARGVLPSEARKSARDDLRNVKQKNRRGINRQLARIDSIDTYMEDPRVEDLKFYPNAEIGYVVSDRRGADKLSVMRWAEQRTKQEGITDPHLRYAFAKKHLPKNLAGRHALTHIRTIDGFCDGTGTTYGGCEIHSRSYGIYKQTSRSKERSFDWLVDHFTKLIQQPGQHQALNREIKKVHSFGHIRNIPGTFRRVDGKFMYDREKVTCGGCNRPRVLAGSHDVAAWVGDIFFPRRTEYVTHSWWRQGFGVEHREKTPYHEEWKVAAEKFI